MKNPYSLYPMIRLRNEVIGNIQLYKLRMKIRIQYRKFVLRAIQFGQLQIVTEVQTREMIIEASQTRK